MAAKKKEISGTIHSKITHSGNDPRIINISEEKCSIEIWDVHKSNTDKDTYRLKSGDLLKIFNTVSDGDVAWQGTINLDHDIGKKQIPLAMQGYERQASCGALVHGIQDGFDADEWGKMFFKNLPAKLTKKDGTIIFGALEPFCETGTEGVLWAVSDYSAAGYDALNILEDGDKLEAYSAVRDGNILWQGGLDLEDMNDGDPFIPLKKCPKGVAHDVWRSISFSNNPVIVTPKP